MNYLDASTVHDLEPAASVLAGMCDRARHLGIDVMVVGATARDILIRHHLGTIPSRATADIDIGLAVSSWADVERFTGPLQQAPGIPHKFRVKGTDVDIVPFGEIESPGRTITWSNDHEMDVFGFREAYAAAVSVKLPGDVVVAVASLAAQSLLKLFAWRDRRYQDRRDAVDLKTILLSYSSGPYFDELYDRHLPLLAQHDHDPTLAGAARIGIEAAAVVASSDRTAIAKDILLPEARFDALATDMGGLVGHNQQLIVAYREAFS